MKRLVFAALLVSCVSVYAGEFRTSGTKVTWFPYSTRNTDWTPPLAASGPGYPVATSRGPLTVPGAKDPLIIDVVAKVVDAGGLLATFAKATTPVGAALTLLGTAAMLSDVYRDITRKNDGWEVTEKEGTQSCMPPPADSTRPGGVYTGPGNKLIDPVTCFWEVTWVRWDGQKLVTGATGISSVSEQDKKRIISDAELARQIANKSGWPSGVYDELTNAVNSPLVTPNLEVTQLTGPSSVPGPTTSTTSAPDADGKTTTTNTTKVINITYQGDKIVTTTTTSTTNIVNNPDGTTTTTPGPTTTTEPEATPLPSEEPGLLCSLFPDILACKKLDEPGQEDIPKQTQDITRQTGPTFSGGSCPPDVVVHVGGQQVTVLSTAQPCGWIESYMKPIILLLASISAAFIVLPRAD